MSNCPLREQWRHFLAGKLCESDAGSLAAHLDDCRACQQILDELLSAAEPDWSVLRRPDQGLPAEKALLAELRQVLIPSPSRTPTAGRAAAPDVALEAEAARAWRPSAIPGYELLEELGRGGMGVVYKARQVRLNRMTALKLLLGGDHADPESRARFRTEVEAFAQLQHPHIIQIHEVGEHEGCAYFSMEFADGGSLKQHLQGRPQPSDQAARLIEALARAMHYAPPARDHSPGLEAGEHPPCRLRLSAFREAASG